MDYGDNDWEEYLDEDGHEDDSREDSDEDNRTDFEADADQNEDDLANYPALKARRALYETARESGMPANIVEDARLAYQQEVANTNRLKDDALATLKQRAAVSSSHAHKFQEHKTTISHLDEKISKLEAIRTTADNDRRDAIKHAQSRTRWQ